jgi:hypothetical protein
VTDDPLSISQSKNLSGLASWDGFLPPNAVVMVRATSPSSASVETEASVREASAHDTSAHDTSAREALAAAEEKPIAASAGGSTLRFQFEAPGLEDPARKTLFDKILSALELNASDYEISPKIGTGASALVTVRFTATMDDQEDVGAFAPVTDRESVLTTFSLEAMLENPGLKKPVWSHLKEALARVRSFRS